MKQVVAIAVMDGDKMLMGRRRDSGKWTNPGGHMEPGEDHKEAAHRELREEAGIDVADMTYLGARVTKTDDGERLLIHCYYCHIPTGCPTTMKEDPDEEVHRWHWINIAGGCPGHVHENLHVPMERNILFQLMECTDVKKSDVYDSKQVTSHMAEVDPIGDGGPSRHKKQIAEHKKWKLKEVPIHEIKNQMGHPASRPMKGNDYGESDEDVAQEYAKKPSQSAPHLISEKHPDGGYRVIDGAHRLRAAHLRGDKKVKTFVPHEEIKKSEDLEKGKRKKGYRITHGHEDSVIHTGPKYSVKHKGKEIGFMRFHDQGKHLEATDVYLNPEHKRKGLGTAMYQAAEKRYGKKFKQSKVQSEEGKAFWDRPKKERGFGKSDLFKDESADPKDAQEKGYSSHGHWAPLKEIHHLETEERGNAWPEHAHEYAQKNPDHKAIWVTHKPSPKYDTNEGHDVDLKGATPLIHDDEYPHEDRGYLYVKKSDLLEDFIEDLFKDEEGRKKQFMKMMNHDPEHEPAASFAAKMPNINWGLWYMRNYKKDPITATHPDTQSKIEHHMNMASVNPQHYKGVQFDKKHDIEHGLKTFQDIETEQQRRREDALVAEGATGKKSPASHRMVHPQGKKLLDLGNGWAWHDLQTNQCDKEAKAMGHCGKTQLDTILSLRKEHKFPDRTVMHEPFITASMTNDGRLQEIKAAGNKKPEPKWHKAILSLLHSPHIKSMDLPGGYQPGSDFQLEDLKPEQLDDILNKKPNISRFYAHSEDKDKILADPRRHAEIKNAHKIMSPEEHYNFHGKLAQDESDDVRWELAKNPNLHPGHQKTLAQDESDMVRWELAKNPNLHPDHQKTLAQDESDMVRRPLAKNPNLHPDHQKTLAQDESDMVRRELAKNPNITPDALKRMIFFHKMGNGEVSAALSDNPKLSPEHHGDFVEAAINALHGDYDSSTKKQYKDAMKIITKRGDLHPDAQEKLASMQFGRRNDPFYFFDIHPHTILSERTDLSEKAQKALALNPKPRADSLVLLSRNKSIIPEAQRALLDRADDPWLNHYNEGFRKAIHSSLMENPNVDDEIKDAVRERIKNSEKYGFTEDGKRIVVHTKDGEMSPEEHAKLEEGEDTKKSDTWNDRQRKYMESGAEGIAHYTMHPKDFLKLTTSSDQDINHIMEEAKPHEFYESPEIKADMNVPPHIVIDDKGAIHGHEGRHRAAAALKAGHDKFTIGVVAHKKESSWDPGKHGQRWERKLQMPKTLTGQFSHDVHVVRPEGIKKLNMPWWKEGEDTKKSNMKKSMSEIYDLIKNKKEMIKMYPEEKRQEAAPFVKWAHEALPNMNWKTWAVRHHREKPQDFTSEVKQKLQHFAGSQHIPDVANVRFEKDHDLKQGMDMLQGAENKFNEERKKKLNLVPAEGKVITKTPSGKVWVNLERGACEGEGNAMGHCGNVPSVKDGDELLSLRTVHKIGDKTYHEPHLTFINNAHWMSGTNFLGEMKGRGNDKPAKHYHEDIMKLLEKGYTPIGGGYMPENNFHIDDLSDRQKDRLLQKHPNALVGSKTHAAPEKSLNKVIQAMQEGMEVRGAEYEDEDGDLDYHTDHIPSFHIADAIAHNPGLNKKHVDHIQKYLRDNDPDYAPYDYQDSLKDHKRNTMNKLLRHKSLNFGQLKELLNAETTDYEHDGWADENPIDHAGHNPNITPKQFAELAIHHGYFPNSDHPKINKDYVDHIANHYFEKQNDPLHTVGSHLQDVLGEDDDHGNAKLFDKLLSSHYPGDFFSHIGNHPDLNKDHLKQMMNYDFWRALSAAGHRDNLVSSDLIDNIIDLHLPKNLTPEQSAQMSAQMEGNFQRQGIDRIISNKNWTKQHTLKYLDGVKEHAEAEKKGDLDRYRKHFFDSASTATRMHPLDDEIIDKIKKLPKKYREYIQSFLGANRHLDVPTIQKIMPKTKKGQKDFLEDIAANKHLPYETKIAVLPEKLKRNAFDTKHPIPEKEFHETWDKIKERIKPDAKGIKLADEEIINAMLDHRGVPVSILKDILKTTENHTNSNYYKKIVQDALENKKESLEKTASVGHGALGAPTSLVGGATGAYGLKPPALNPDIRGEGGADRARTAIGKLFGKKDTEEMLTALNKNEDGEDQDESVDFSDKEISFPHNRKQHTLAYKDEEHPRSDDELYNKLWHQERANHDMADWFKRHATKEDLTKILEHFNHDLPFIYDHDLKGKDPDGIVKDGNINFRLHGIPHRHPAYEDVLEDARLHLPKHLGEYKDDEHYDDLHDRFLDFAHEQAHIKAQEGLKSEKEGLRKGDLRHRRRFELKPTKEQAKKIEKAGLGEYFNKYRSLGHVDYDLPEDGNLSIENMQTDFDKSPAKKIREKLKEMYEKNEISYPQKEEIYQESTQDHPHENHKFLTRTLFNGHDPKEVLRAAFEAHMGKHGVIPASKPLFKNPLDSEFYRDELLRKDDGDGEDKMTAERAAEIFKEINDAHEANTMTGNQFIEKYREHPEAGKVEQASLEALESNDPEKFAPWAKAYFRHTPPDVAAQLMNVVRQRSTLADNYFFQNALAKEVPHFKEAAIHPFMGGVETGNLSEESLNHVLPRIMDMEDEESKGQYLQKLLKNENISADHVKKILDAGHEFAVSHPKAPEDAKKRFLEKAGPSQLWNFYEKNHENLDAEGLNSILSHPKLDLHSNIETEHGPKYKQKILEHALVNHPDASFEEHYPMLGEREKQDAVQRIIQRSTTNEKFHKEAAENPNIMKNLMVDSANAKGSFGYNMKQWTGNILEQYLNKAKEEGRPLSPDFMNEATRFITKHDEFDNLIPALLNHHEGVTDEHLNHMMKTYPRNMGTIARHDSPIGEKVRQQIIENPMEYDTLGNDPIGSAFSHAGKDKAEEWAKDFGPAATQDPARRLENMDQFMSKHLPNAIGPQVPPSVYLGIQTDFNRPNEEGEPGKIVYSWQNVNGPVDFHKPPGAETFEVRKQTSDAPKFFDTKEEAREYAKGLFGEGIDRLVKNSVVHGLLQNPHIRKQLDLPEVIEGLHDQGINFNSMGIDHILRGADVDELEKYLNHEKLHPAYLQEKNYNHPLRDFKNTLNHHLEKHGFVVSPESVTMSHDTAKLREIRDKIEEAGGEVHKRDIERLGYNLASLGLNDKISPQGKLSAEAVQKTIDERPKHTFGVSHTQFGTTGDGNRADYYYADSVDEDSEPTDGDYEAAQEEIEERYPIHQYFAENLDYDDFDPDDDQWQEHLSDNPDDWVMENPHHDPDYHHWAKQLAEMKDPDKDEKDEIDKVHHHGDWIDQLKYEDLNHRPTKEDGPQGVFGFVNEYNKEDHKKKFEEFKQEIKDGITENPDARNNPMSFHDLAAAHAPNISVHHESPAAAYHQHLDRDEVAMHSHPEYENRKRDAQQKAVDSASLWDHDDIVESYRNYNREDVSDRAWEIMNERGGGNEAALANQEQRHNHDLSDVFQLNWTNDHVKQMKDAGVFDKFQNLADSWKTQDSIHPEGKNSIGWVRYTKGNDGVHIDEIQSPFGQSLNEKHKKLKQKVEGGELSPVDAQKGKGDLEDLNKIHGILFGDTKNHPNNVIHDAFLQHLRDRGYSGQKVHIFQLPEAQEKGGHSTGRAPSVHMKETYDKWPKKQGGYKPAKYGEMQTQYGEKWEGRNTWGQVLKKMQELKDKINAHNS